MHKSTIIQLVLIIIGIVSFFNGLEVLLINFVNLAGWLNVEFRNSGLDGMVVLSTLLISVSYFLLAYFFIVRSRHWSGWITKKAKLSSGLTAQASPVDVLYFLFVIIGSYALLKELPRFLGKVFNWFSITVARNHDSGLQPDSRLSWIQSFLSILVPVLTILLAKYLAIYFAGKTDSRENLSITDDAGQNGD